MHELIFYFYSLGMTQKQIVDSLSEHGYRISERHLRRLLSNFGLYRRKNYSCIGDVTLLIHKELKTCGKLHGYRWMYHKCNQNGLHVRKEDVRLLINAMDPDSCELR